MPGQIPSDRFDVFCPLMSLPRWLEIDLDNDPDGFFLMVEGGRIDHASHSNYFPEMLGEVGGKIHTGRSRNDQVAVALRLYMLDRLIFGGSRKPAGACSSVDRERGYPLRFRDPRNRDAVPVLLVPAGTDLQRDRDVDRPDDLPRLGAFLARHPESCPRTRALLDSWGLTAAS